MRPRQRPVPFKPRLLAAARASVAVRGARVSRGQTGQKLARRAERGGQRRGKRPAEGPRAKALEAGFFRRRAASDVGRRDPARWQAW